MDRFDELSCFIAVVETGGFSKAARQCGVTQGMVSKAVAALEGRLGVSLFHRSTRQVVVTEQGHAYYERCSPLLEELEAVSAQAAHGTNALRGVLHVAAPASFGRLVLAPLLPVFFSRYPDLKLDLLMADNRTDLIANGTDVALRVGGEDDPGEIVRRLGRTRLHIVGSSSYFRRYGRPADPAELARHNCLIYGRDAKAGLWKFRGPQGLYEVPVHGCLRTDNLDTLRTAAIAGVGLTGLTAASISEDMSDMSTVLDDFVPWQFDIKAVWVKRRFVPAKVRIFVDFLAEQLHLRPGIKPVD